VLSADKPNKLNIHIGTLKRKNKTLSLSWYIEKPLAGIT
jgi:hypothetical protein